jgi:hypothetical protein
MPNLIQRATDGDYYVGSRDSASAKEERLGSSGRALLLARQRVTTGLFVTAEGVWARFVA